MRCKITGSLKRLPVKGACPECGTPGVRLTGKGFVGAHDVRADLGEGPQISITDDGTSHGAPHDAAVKRETEAARERVQQGVKPLGKTRTGESSTVDPVNTTGHGRGPALVRGRNMDARQPTRWNPKTREREVSSIGTMGGNLGRVHLDDPEPRDKGRRTPSQRNNYRKRMRREAAKRKGA